MAYTSEIEKLEQRYRENPKGRNFAPLADAYRKAGLIDNAIELCQAGIASHPDYISAYIVYGRCLIDKKDDPGAEGVFGKVLDLDKENILALRILAEIANRNNRPDKEVEWLTRLLTADPMNGDAAEDLAQAKGRASQAAKTTEPIATAIPDPAATAPAPPEPSAPPAAAAAAELPPLERVSVSFSEAETKALEQPDFEVERSAPPENVTPSQGSSTPPAGIEVFDGALDFNGAAHDAAKADGIEVEEPLDIEPDNVAVEGLARTQYEGSGVFNTPPAETLPSEPVTEDLPSVDLPLIMPDDVMPIEPAAAAPPAPPARRSAPPAPAPVPAAVALSDDDGAADTAALSKVEPVLTETMAELYLRQGHRGEALRVYRALLVQRPGDRRLRAKVDELSGRAKAGGGQSIGAFLKSVLSGRGSADVVVPTATPVMVVEAEPAPPASSESSGSTLESAFDTAEEPAAADTHGSPTRPASDAISLDSVFGETGAEPAVFEDTGAGPEPETEPSSGSTAEKASAGGGEGSFSFDEFFSPPASPSSATPKAPRRSGRQSRQVAAEDEADLDQFQSWLKGLKS